MKMILSLTLLVMLSAHAASDNKITVYTHRNEQLIKPLFEAYQKESGVEVEFLTGDAGALLQRVKAEGAGTKADLFISVDAGSLWLAQQDNLFEPVKSEILNKNIPEFLRDPKGNWFGLSLRARTIFYNKDKVKKDELTDYAGLADPKWKGRLCLRTSKKVYNQSLVAMLIDQYGEKKAESIVKGWVSNLATEVFSNDTKLLEAISSGECHIGFANTYYMARLQQDKKALNVKAHFPKNTHINISGGGVLKHSDNKKAAQALLEWLTTPKAQKMFADSNMEYAVVEGIEPAPIVKAWGEPKASTQPLYRAGELQRKAIMLMDRQNYK